MAPKEIWKMLGSLFARGESVNGTIMRETRVGFAVDIYGVVAMLPRKEADINRVLDAAPLLQTTHLFRIIKLDPENRAIIVSRRRLLVEERIATLRVGEAIEGVVKRITDYGAFIDVGDIEGFLHITEMAWRPVGHPADLLSVGDKVKVAIMRTNPNAQRAPVRLSMKQLQADPWLKAERKYPAGSRVKGIIRKIADYGAFVELEPGIEGLLHVTEMTWRNLDIHPEDMVRSGQLVDVEILHVDAEKRCVPLSLRSMEENPWQTFDAVHPKGSIVEGTIHEIIESSLIIMLDGGIDGMSHLSAG